MKKIIMRIGSAMRRAMFIGMILMMVKVKEMKN